MNRLASQASPYLRQHADNPVDWYPWGEEAFARAREENKPIFLSIGYSSCHWCHVMAHESFEDETTAALMNDWFINIKVDREERPDVDALYMDVTQALSGSGGWPMTVFTTPDGKPFFAGTYFPKDIHEARPSFTELLEAIHEAWENKQGDVTAQANEIATSIAQHAELRDLIPSTLSVHRDEIIRHTRESLLNYYDPEWGGFGGAPKFPQTHALGVLAAFAENGDDDAQKALTNSLDAMAAGGIYDHLGGGFARYSTDAFWMVPHFEKMLYDQAQLLSIYTRAYELTQNIDYKLVANETVTYVLRDLSSPEGGFYSSEDADSINEHGESEEGAFYLWRQEEIEEVCGPNAQAAIDFYGITKSGNFEARNILHRPERGNLTRPDGVERACVALLARRDSRPRPGRDDKVLTEWNGLFIGALADAARVFQRPEWANRAEAAAEFALSNLVTGGALARSWHHNAGATHRAVANDYATFIDGCVRLYDATNNERWLSEATRFADEFIAEFYDEERGGFFTVAKDGEQLFAQAKDVMDGATASANSLSATALLRLGQLTDNSVYTQHANAILDLLAEPMAKHPLSFTALLEAVLETGTK